MGFMKTLSFKYITSLVIFIPCTLPLLPIPLPSKKKLNIFYKN